MASPNINNNNDIGNVQCPACRGVCKEPKILPACNHSACEACLEDIFLSALVTKALPLLTIPRAEFPVPKATKQLTAGECVGVACPVCDEVSAVDARCGVGSLQTNAELKALCDKRGGASKPCSECEVKVADGECSECKVAECECDQCEVAMCDSCFVSLHNTGKAFKSHKQLPLGKASESKALLYCPVHPNQPISGFCETDQAMVCGVCMVTDHAGHKCVTVEEANRKFTATNAEMCAQIRQLCESITPSIPHLRALSQKVSLSILIGDCHIGLFRKSRRMGHIFEH